MELIPELIKLLRTKSTIRYLPPKGTAGLARSRVRGKSRLPLPPASTMPNTRICDGPALGKTSSCFGVFFFGMWSSRDQCSCGFYQSHTLRGVKFCAESPEDNLSAEISPRAS